MRFRTINVSSFVEKFTHYSMGINIYTFCTAHVDSEPTELESLNEEYTFLRISRQTWRERELHLLEGFGRHFQRWVILEDPVEDDMGLHSYPLAGRRHNVSRAR